MPLLLIAALVVAFLAVVFALQNSAPVEVSLGIWQFEASLAIILLITLALGFFVGLCVALPALIRRNLRISRQKKQIAQLQEELVEARTGDAGDFSASPRLGPSSAYPEQSDADPAAPTAPPEQGSGQVGDPLDDSTESQQYR